MNELYVVRKTKVGDLMSLNISKLMLPDDYDWFDYVNAGFRIDFMVEHAKMENPLPFTSDDNQVLGVYRNYQDAFEGRFRIMEKMEKSPSIKWIQEEQNIKSS